MERGYLVSEAAKILDVTERTVWNYLRRGKLKGKRIKKKKDNKRKVYIDKTSLFVCKMEKEGVYIGRNAMLKYFNDLWETVIVYREVTGITMGISELFLRNEISEEDLEEKFADYWKISEVAAYMEVSERTVRRYIKAGKLKAVKTLPSKGTQLFLSTDVAELYLKLHGKTQLTDEEEEKRFHEEVIAYYSEHSEFVQGLMDDLEELL